jgi:hypothetical protein
MCGCNAVCMLCRTYVCMLRHTYVCMYVALYICIYVAPYICMYVCCAVHMYVCCAVHMYVCCAVHMYVCMLRHFMFRKLKKKTFSVKSLETPKRRKYWRFCNFLQKRSQSPKIVHHNIETMYVVSKPRRGSYSI